MENNYLEYKSDIPQKVNKLKAEMVSFLNSEGGIILLGVDDNGEKIENIDKKYKEWEEIISNWIFSAFYPSVVDLIEVKIDKLFAIHIKKGTNKPYYFKDGDGFNSKGVYIRVGSTKRIANYEEIQRMMIASKAQEYERLVSNNQKLSFDYVTARLNEKGIEFNPHGLSLLNVEGQYNNAALLLSDQNPTISKFAMFQGKDVSIFLDKKEFKGSILRQLEELLYYTNLSNKKKVIITGKAQRDEYDDFPRRALREVICNCFCHRDYFLSGDIKVEYYDDKVMIFSPGSLPNGLTVDDIKDGMTAKRNQILVDAFDKLDIIENYASGVRRIFMDYEGFDRLPEYNVSDNKVIVTLYNRNYTDTEGVPKDVPKDVPNKLKLNERRLMIIKLIKKNPKYTIKEMSVLLNVSDKTIKRDLEALKKDGVLYREGSLFDGNWIVK